MTALLFFTRGGILANSYVSFGDQWSVVVMIVGGTDELIQDIAVCFAVPAVCFALALINIRFTPRSKHNALKLRLFLTFTLALFAFFFSSFMYQDRSVLKALWLENRILYSFIFVLSIALILTGIIAVIYWKLRPQLWTTRNCESGEVIIANDSKSGERE